ncbi:MAG: hypothetical protein ACRD9Q_01495 [Nitrososphaeraceae archaeon]
MVIIVTLSIFATVIASLAFMPVVQEIGYNPEHWVNASSQAISARDEARTAILSLPIFLVGALVIFGFLAVSRRDYGEFGI